MKMRHRAIPGDPKDKRANLSSDQKLHVQVRLEENDTILVLWFRKVNDSIRNIYTCHC